MNKRYHLFAPGAWSWTASVRRKRSIGALLNGEMESTMRLIDKQIMLKNNTFIIGAALSLIVECHDYILVQPQSHTCYVLIEILKRRLLKVRGFIIRSFRCYKSTTWCQKSHEIHSLRDISLANHVWFDSLRPRSLVIHVFYLYLVRKSPF